MLLYCFTSARTGEVHESTARRARARESPGAIDFGVPLLLGGQFLCIRTSRNQHGHLNLCNRDQMVALGVTTTMDSYLVNSISGLNLGGLLVLEKDVS